MIESMSRITLAVLSAILLGMAWEIWLLVFRLARRLLFGKSGVGKRYLRKAMRGILCVMQCVFVSVVLSVFTYLSDVGAGRLLLPFSFFLGYALGRLVLENKYYDSLEAFLLKCHEKIRCFFRWFFLPFLRFCRFFLPFLCKMTRAFFLLFHGKYVILKRTKNKRERASNMSK